VGDGDGPVVRDMIVWDNGVIPALVVAGSFTEPGAFQRERIAYWYPYLYELFPAGPNNTIHALELHDDGGGLALYAGGEFNQIGTRQSMAIGRFGCEPAPCVADFDGDGALTLFDFLAFQSAFDLAEPRADLDGDGALTLFDFLAFQSAFSSGCP
jgi:hypothetical protein